jgi:hypothetical protein
MDYMYALNTLFCLVIVILGVKRYRSTGAKAFLFIAFAYTLFGISHFTMGMGWTFLKPTLTALRTTGYFMMIIGLLI